MDGEWGDYIALLGLVNMLDIPVAVVSSLGEEGLGPDYMANFSPVNRAEISARLLKQILLKSNCRLHGVFFSPGRNSAQAENPSPV